MSLGGVWNSTSVGWWRPEGGWHNERARALCATGRPKCPPVKWMAYIETPHGDKLYAGGARRSIYVWDSVPALYHVIPYHIIHVFVHRNKVLQIKLNMHDKNITIDKPWQIFFTVCDIWTHNGQNLAPKLQWPWKRTYLMNQSIALQHNYMPIITPFQFSSLQFQFQFKPLLPFL